MRAAEVAHHLGGAKRNGNGWLCRCPAHVDRAPSLSLHDGDAGRLLVRCFAGCDVQRVLSALRGLHLLEGSGVYVPPSPEEVAARQHKERGEIEKRKKLARKWWNEAIPAQGTLAEIYLNARGINMTIPATLRFHPGLEHTSTSMILPAMIGAVSIAPSREINAIWRTYLRADGKAKAPVSDAKKGLGPVGGGAVRLAPASEKLAVSEGIETGLSVMQATGIPTWAALSAAGMEMLILPPQVREVIIAADNDASGRGLHAAKSAARRWVAEGRLVRIALPAETGKDFNDILMTENAA